MSESGAPHQITNVDGTLFFLANSDAANGFELWKSDGTPAGTEMVRDIEASTFSPNEEAKEFTAVGDRLFFTFKTADGRELWTSDGTFGGTEMVKNIDGGPGDSLRYSTETVAFGGELYFLADDGVDGRELWRSDGTELGTTQVADLNGSSNDSFCCGADFAVRGGELFFSGNFRLYKYDGTGAPVQIVTPGTSSHYATTNLDGRIFFHDLHALYRYDGGPSAEKVADVGTIASDLTAFEGNLYFPADGGDGKGLELWRSTGTAAGTERLTDINPGGDSLIDRLSVAGDNLFFRGDDNGSTGVELWETHGDAAPPQHHDHLRPGRGRHDHDQLRHLRLLLQRGGLDLHLCPRRRRSRALQLRHPDLQRPRRRRPQLRGRRHRQRRQR